METVMVPSVEEIFERVSKLPPDEIVGKCNDAFSCLVATHLQWQYPRLDFSVQLGSEQITYLPFDEAGESGFLHFQSVRYADRPETIPFTQDMRTWRAAKGFDRIGERNVGITAREATIYLRGFMEATKEGWS